MTFCPIHDRVELQDGKCVACGEVEYLTQSQKDMGDKKRVKYLMFGYSLVFTIIVGIMWIFS